ncbi:hypothetical protein NDU88_012507 [Pleurodeles waltl]|uniref:Uncharacterized protein n=1 Tax=Pleurodeles waltl TaxID=8319 RepID=A0AAV7R301_PLEWA|nr:hypothetical protein NDU88_012507 [Pleurodeles waltl]
MCLHVVKNILFDTGLVPTVISVYLGILLPTNEGFYEQCMTFTALSKGTFGLSCLLGAFGLSLCRRTSRSTFEVVPRDAGRSGCQGVQGAVHKEPGVSQAFCGRIEAARPAQSGWHSSASQPAPLPPAAGRPEPVQAPDCSGAEPPANLLVVSAEPVGRAQTPLDLAAAPFL